MKRIAFVVAAVSLFALAPLTARLGPVAGSVALVWLGVLVATLASGSAHSLGVAAGALGAFGGGVLSSTSPAAAGAVLVAAAFVERTTRVRSRTARAVHVLLALVGGALAGALSNAFTSASLSVFAVAALVAGVLAALPLLVDADDPLAHALDEAAELLPEPVKRSLAAGAELRRNVAEIPLDRATAAKVKTTWHSLLRLAEARLRLERTRPRALLRAAEPAPADAAPSAADAVLEMVDQRIAEHVSVLGRTYTAVDTVTAARLGLDDSALKHVESMGESLDEVSRALVEVRAEQVS
jgi:MFS family permease